MFNKDSKNDSHEPIVQEAPKTVVEKPVVKGPVSNKGVTTAYTCLRDKAGNNDPSKLILDKGEQVTILENVGEFLKIRTSKGVEGYCVKSNIKVG